MPHPYRKLVAETVQLLTHELDRIGALNAVDPMDRADDKLWGAHLRDARRTLNRLDVDVLAEAHAPDGYDEEADCYGGHCDACGRLVCLDDGVSSDDLPGGPKGRDAHYYHRACVEQPEHDDWHCPRCETLNIHATINGPDGSTIADCFECGAQVLACHGCACPLAVEDALGRTTEFLCPDCYPRTHCANCKATAPDLQICLPAWFDPDDLSTPLDVDVEARGHYWCADCEREVEAHEALAVHPCDCR